MKGTNKNPHQILPPPCEIFSLFRTGYLSFFLLTMMDSFTIPRRANADEISLICNISHDPNAITMTSRFPLLSQIRLAFENENVKWLSFRFQPVSFPMSDDTNHIIQTIMEKLADNKTLKSFRWNMDLSHDFYLQQLTNTISTNNLKPNVLRCYTSLTRRRR